MIVNKLNEYYGTKLNEYYGTSWMSITEQVEWVLRKIFWSQFIDHQVLISLTPICDPISCRSH